MEDRCVGFLFFFFGGGGGWSSSSSPFYNQRTDYITNTTSGQIPLFSTDGNEYKFLHFITHWQWTLNKVTAPCILVVFSPQMFCFLKNMSQHVFRQQLSLLLARKTRQTPRWQNESKRSRWFDPTLKSPAMYTATFTRQLVNCCPDSYLVNPTKPTEMSQLIIVLKNACRLISWRKCRHLHEPPAQREVGTQMMCDPLWSSDHWNAEVHYTRMQHGCFFVVERLRR